MEFLETLPQGLKTFGAGVSLVLAVWALAARLDKALLKHLIPHFVPRADLMQLNDRVTRIEAKLDIMMTRMFDDNNFH